MQFVSSTLVVFLLILSASVRAEDRSGEWCWTDYALGIVAGTTAIAAAPVVISAAGFTSAGVAAGSLAAGVQSVFYGGAVGSTTIFAGLQSAGAAGIGLGTNVAIGTTVGSAVSYIKRKVYPCNKGPSCSSQED